VNVFPLCWRFIQAFYPEIGKSIQLTVQLSNRQLRDDEIYNHIREKFLPLIPLDDFNEPQVAAYHLLQTLTQSLNDLALVGITQLPNGAANDENPENSNNTQGPSGSIGDESEHTESDAADSGVLGAGTGAAQTGEGDS
jgi:hypothetical protein